MPYEGRYNRVICSVLNDESKRLVAVDKARQMMLTWEVAFYLLHLAMTRPFIEIGVKGKREGESGYILDERMMTLWGNLPRFLREAYPVRLNRSNNVLYAPLSGARVYGLSEKFQGVHGKVFHTFYGDECAYMRNFELLHAGLLPIGGRIIYTSTPYFEGAWYRLVKGVVSPQESMAA